MLAIQFNDRWRKVLHLRTNNKGRIIDKALRCRGEQAKSLKKGRAWP